MENLNTFYMPQDIEKEKWDIYFKNVEEGSHDENFNSLWWQTSDIHAAQIIKKYLNPQEPISILEAGSGSGVGSLCLEKKIPIQQIKLVDISYEALNYSKKITPTSLQNKVQYIQSDIINMPIKDESVDLCWNIGVIEHYKYNFIEKIVKEMLRVTKIGGYTIIAIPNYKSIATLKGWLLGSSFGKAFLNKVPGYRFDTEILYSNREMLKYLSKISNSQVKLEFAGNCLWVNAPSKLVKLTNFMFHKSSFSFLSFFIIKKQ